MLAYTYIVDFYVLIVYPVIWINSLISAQLSSVAQSFQLFVTSCTAACQVSLSITNSRSLLNLTSIELLMPSNHLILCQPLLPPSIFPSIRVFSNESALPIRWPEYRSFNSSISLFNEYSGLISLRMDWLDFKQLNWNSITSTSFVRSDAS